MWVCVCLPLGRLEESPHKEILHQCRPDYRSERDQCQKAQSRVMRPNGETSRGLFNVNEYTMWAQGGMRGRVGESWPDWWGGRVNHSVWERRGRCYVDCAHSGGSYLKTWLQQKEFAQLKYNVQIPTLFWELKGHFKVIDFSRVFKERNVISATLSLCGEAPADWFDLKVDSILTMVLSQQTDVHLIRSLVNLRTIYKWKESCGHWEMYR